MLSILQGRFLQDKLRSLFENSRLALRPMESSRVIRSVSMASTVYVTDGGCFRCHFAQLAQIYYPMLFLGIIASGAVFAGTNPAYTHFELSHHFKTSQTKFIIAEADLLPAVLAAAKDCGIRQSNIQIFDTQNEAIPSGFKSWQSLMDHGERDWVRFNDEEASKWTTAARLFSSGTTGLPKAAALSHYNLIAQHTLVNEAHPLPYEVRAYSGCWQRATLMK
jgi:acyl-CoA synthetase (AMP-forming)/AMP-acid ligase II